MRVTALFGSSKQATLRPVVREQGKRKNSVVVVCALLYFSSPAEVGPETVNNIAVYRLSAVSTLRGQIGAVDSRTTQYGKEGSLAAVPRIVLVVGLIVTVFTCSFACGASLIHSVLFTELQTSKAQFCELVFHLQVWRYTM